MVKLIRIYLKKRHIIVEVRVSSHDYTIKGFRFAKVQFQILHLIINAGRPTTLVMLFSQASHAGPVLGAQLGTCIKYGVRF